MKLDTKALRYLTNEDWRVLNAVEIGSKNHEIVPTTLIVQLSHLRSGSGVHKSISTLAKANLIARTKNAKYDGYRLTYGGLDYLSLHTHMKQGTLYSTGNCIGAGKESDIYVCAPPPSPGDQTSSSFPSSSLSRQHILKIHRLGRISFRSIKNNRDYLRHRTAASWMYMSRLAAQKEFVFMKALGEAGFVVPQAIAQNRHTIVMELVDGVPLRNVRRVGDPAGLYAELVDIILRLAGVGLIHGDFNEFNIMVRDEDEEEEEEEEGNVGSTTQAGQEEAEGDDTDAKATARIKPVVIDFPQMVSIDHFNAEMYFDRDVNCIKAFFKRRFGFTSEQPGPFFANVKKSVGEAGAKRLDVAAEASGFSKKMAKELESYMKEVGANGGRTDDECTAEEDRQLHYSEQSDDDIEDILDRESSDGKSKLDGVREKCSNVLAQDMMSLSIEKG